MVADCLAAVTRPELSSNRGPGRDVSVHCDQPEHGIIIARSCQEHSLRLHASELGRFQIGNDHYGLTDQVLRIIELSYSCDYLSYLDPMSTLRTRKRSALGCAEASTTLPVQLHLGKLVNRRLLCSMPTSVCALACAAVSHSSLACRLAASCCCLLILLHTRTLLHTCTFTSHSAVHSRWAARTAVHLHPLCTLTLRACARLPSPTCLVVRPGPPLDALNTSSTSSLGNSGCPVP